VVVLPVEEFDRLRHRDCQLASLTRFFAVSPLAQAALDLERDQDLGRVIER
jgi:hypothetical protein